MSEETNTEATTGGLSIARCLSEMTYAEMERVEKVAGGITFGSMFSDFANISARSLKALGYVWAQRTEPNLKIADFESRPMLEWEEFGGGLSAEGVEEDGGPSI